MAGSVREGGRRRKRKPHVEPASGRRSFWKLRRVVVFKAAPPPARLPPSAPRPRSARTAALTAPRPWPWWDSTWASRAATSPWRGPAASRRWPTSSATAARREYGGGTLGRSAGHPSRLEGAGSFQGVPPGRNGAACPPLLPSLPWFNKSPPKLGCFKVKATPAGPGAELSRLLFFAAPWFPLGPRTERSASRLKTR